MWLVIIVGVVVSVLAFVFGESKAAIRIRAWFKRVAGELPGALGHVLDFIRAHVDGFRIIGYAVGVGILFLWLSLAGLIAAIVVEVAWQVGLVFIRRRPEPPATTGGGSRGPLATGSSAS
jgi:hypothetical protein